MEHKSQMIQDYRDQPICGFSLSLCCYCQTTCMDIYPSVRHRPYISGTCTNKPCHKACCVPVWVLTHEVLWKAAVLGISAGLYHWFATSFETTHGVAYASCKWTPLRHVNTDVCEFTSRRECAAQGTRVVDVYETCS